MAEKQEQCRIVTHKLRDSKWPNGREMLLSYSYKDFVSDPDMVENYISFTSLLYYEKTDTLYLGLTTFSNDLFYRFDRQSGEFTSLGYREIANKYDAKIHRSLVLGNNGKIYFGTAVLHDPDRYFEFPGGSLVEYDPAENSMKRLARPVEHSPLQSITIDVSRNIIYGMTFMPEMLFRHDLESGESRILTMTGTSARVSAPHKPAVDDNGNLWSTYGSGYNQVPVKLLKYSPENDRIEWYDHAIPKSDANDHGVPDCMINGGDGYIYIGCKAGLVRLDTEKASCELLTKPYEGERLSGLAVGPDGHIYGIGGGESGYTVFSWDPSTRKTFIYGELIDRESGTTPYIIHDVAVTNDRVVYGGEIDNIERSSRLWECILA